VSAANKQATGKTCSVDLNYVVCHLVLLHFWAEKGVGNICIS